MNRSLLLAAALALTGCGKSSPADFPAPGASGPATAEGLVALLKERRVITGARKVPPGPSRQWKARYVMTGPKVPEECDLVEFETDAGVDDYYARDADVLRDLDAGRLKTAYRYRGRFLVAAHHEADLVASVRAVLP